MQVCDKIILIDILMMFVVDVHIIQFNMCCKFFCTSQMFLKNNLILIQTPTQTKQPEAKD